MGCYVNPPTESKEAFLQREGRVISANEAKITETEYPVCLVFNGPFNAAGVGYSLSEIQAFADVSDSRPKIWYMVPTEKLKAVSDIVKYLPK